MWSMPRAIASRSTRDRFLAVGGRAEDAGAGELHRAVADPVDGDVRGQVEGAAGQGVGGHGFLS